MIKEYREKSTKIKAIQYNGDNYDDILVFVGYYDDWIIRQFENTYRFSGDRILIIKSSEATFMVETGSYIINKDGEFYVCELNEFNKLFEEA